MKAAKQAELEAFWRAHLDGWRNSTLNQREYGAAYGLPLKRFGNWRAKFKQGQAPGGQAALAPGRRSWSYGWSYD